MSGKLIVLDGIDGSGKETQTKLLRDRLIANNIITKSLDFPRYEENFFGRFIKERLNKRDNNFLELDPFIASIVYASDRFESANIIDNWLRKDFFVVLDRYVSSNQIHQGAKIEKTSERKQFLNWLEEMEYNVFGVPKPDIVIYLDMPVEISQNLIKKSGKNIDIAEESLSHQQKSRESANFLVENFENWHKVSCSIDNSIRPIDEIHEEIFNLVLSLNKK